MDTLVTKVKSPPMPQSVRRGMASSQPRGNKSYSFKDERVISLFKLCKKSNRFNHSEIRRPEEVGKTEDPNHFLYHKMLRHPTKNCFIFKDIVQALIDAEVLKFCPE